MIVLIGNAPSSGSTFLADLLDSTSATACGVELSLFANKRLYDFTAFRHGMRKSSLSPSVYKTRNVVNLNRLHSYGLDCNEFAQMLARSDSLQEFVQKFFAHFLALRGKDENGITFEKTPENINCISAFLKYFPGAYFVFLVRNPVYEYASLKKRNFPKMQALGTWLIDAAQYWQHKEKENVIVVRYEDLVREPFRMVREIIFQVSGREIAEEDIAQGYKNNRYRMLHSKKIASWQITETGTIGDANRKAVTQKTLAEIKSMFRYKVSARYARIFQLAPISFKEALQEFGYYDDFVRQTENVVGTAKVSAGAADYLFMMKKWLINFVSGNAALTHLPAILNPYEEIDE